jgi:hypothetical protein
VPDPTDSRGRRANGLPATDWGALVDLDPRLSEGLLDRLAAAGVAAYVEPATAVDTVHRAVTMPSRPLDRLWVDPSRADSAREVVASEVADLTALLAEDDPGATAHGLVHPVPRYAARRVLQPPALPGPPAADAAPPTAAPPTAAPPTAAPPIAAPPTAAPPTAAPPAAGPPAGPSPAGPPGAGPPDPPQTAPRSDEDVFAELVARFHAPDAPSTGGSTAVRWPAAEDLPVPPAPGIPPPPPPPAPGSASPPGPGAVPDPPQRRRSDPPVTRSAPPTPPARPPSTGAGAPRDWVAAEAGDDDGHFVPPPPPPVPRIRLRTLAAVLAVLLGLVALFVPGLLGLPATSGVGVLGLLLLAGGAGALVWSMHDSPDGGPDDGAVV